MLQSLNVSSIDAGFEIDNRPLYDDNQIINIRPVAV